MLGSAADAEDAVQDAFLRWQAADRQRIKVPEAWLVKVVTNLCLDRLHSAQARRERTVGAWLPEPLLDGDPMLGPADTVEQRESVSLAVLTLMERLSPLERAVYLLCEAFSYRHAEIAEILDITESASQQHLHRARRRITTARRRGGEVDPAAARRIIEEFLAAASSGRTERLVALLTDDATAISDGAGLTETLLQYDTPQRIAAVARAGFTPTPAKRRLAGGTPAIHYARVNSAPAILFVLGDQIVGAVTFDIINDKIATVRGIAAPTRLTRLTEAWRQHEPDTPLITQW
jgi:RNA polymerase sigma-70 factor (ECF subfamily)